LRQEARDATAVLGVELREMIEVEFVALSERSSGRCQPPPRRKQSDHEQKSHEARYGRPASPGTIAAGPWVYDGREGRRCGEVGVSTLLRTRFELVLFK
jgi:hypothetical protein